MPRLRADVARDVCTIRLRGDLDNALPAALREVVLRETRPGTTMRIDCAAVDKVSTPCVQLLVAAADYIGRREARFALANPQRPQC